MYHSVVDSAIAKGMKILERTESYVHDVCEREVGHGEVGSFSLESLVFRKDSGMTCMYVWAIFAIWWERREQHWPETQIDFGPLLHNR